MSETNPRGAATAGRLQLALVGVPAVVILLVALDYTRLAFPALDDFWRATPKSDSIFHQVALLYRFWTGRWLTSFFYGLATPRIGIFGPGYAAALVVALLVWFSGFLIASRLLLGRGASGAQVAGLAIALFATFWAGAPAPSEVFYWFSGAFEYGLPFLLSMISLRLLASAVGEKPSLPLAVAAGLVGALASGAHEIAGIILVGASACAAAANWHLGRRPAVIACLAALALVAAGLAINLLAPGNAARAAVFPQGGSIGRAAALTFGSRSTPAGWLLDLRLIAFTLLLLTIGTGYPLRPAWVRIRLPWLLLLPGLTLGCVFGTWFLAAYSLGFPPPGRLQTLLYGLFIIGWAAVVIILREKLDRAGARAGGLRGSQIGTCAAAIFGLALLLSANTRTAVRELPFAHGRWLEANRQQMAEVRTRHGRGETDIILAPVPPHPRLLMNQGLPGDPGRVENQSMATLLGVRTIRAAPGDVSARRVWRGE
jgi:hypothetical protein